MIMFRLELITISRGKEDITLSGILRVIQEKVFHRFREKNALANRRRTTINFEDTLPKTRQPKSKVDVV